MSMARDMVFLHGWGTHPVIWEPLQAFFPGSRALPLPGYAGSEAALGFDEMADRLAAELDENTVLVGWSLGGQLAARMALNYPEKISRLVLIATTPCFVNREDWPHGIAAEVFEQFALSLAEDYAGTIRRFLSLQAQGSDDVRAVLAMLRRKLLEQPRPAEGALEAGLAILQNADLRSDMKRLQVPLTLIHGTGDKLAPIAAARWLAETQPGTRLHEVRGAGHAPFLSQSQTTAEQIAEAAYG
jgi:pimeloyl-[acyl-carrier protein] methyl ester esterase